jgi:hypothetical protein
MEAQIDLRMEAQVDLLMEAQVDLHMEAQVDLRMEAQVDLRREAKVAQGGYIYVPSLRVHISPHSPPHAHLARVVHWSPGCTIQ